MEEKVLGIDIGSDSIKAVQVIPSRKGFRVTACERIRITQVSGENGGLEKGLEALSKEKGLKSDICVASLPGDKILFKNLRIPFKGAKKIGKTVTYQLEPILPLPTSEFVVDYIITSQSEETEVVCACAENRRVDAYLKLLNRFQIEPDILDVDSVPTISWLLHERAENDGIFFDFGHKKTIMALFMNRHIVLIRSFPFGGQKIEYATLQKHKILNDNNTLRSSDGSKGSITRSFESLFYRFLKEVQITLHSFSTNQGKRPFSPEIVFITGGVSLKPEIKEMLEELTDAPIEQIDITKNDRIQMSEDVARAWSAPFMNTALALALRKKREGHGFNLRKGRFEPQKRLLRFRKEMEHLAVVLSIIIFLFGADLYIDYHYLKKRYQRLNQEVTSVFKETFPEVRRIVDPVQQMRIRLNEIKRSSQWFFNAANKTKIVDLLKDISERIPDSITFQVKSLVIDPENVLINAYTDTFNTVDLIKKRLEGSGFFDQVTIYSANLDRSGDRVRFDLRLRRKE
nr:hypothetical protein [Desulfobacterales bacterium]